MRQQAITTYKISIWLLRASSFLAALVLYYFTAVKWVYIDATSIDGSQHYIEVFGED